MSIGRTFTLKHYQSIRNYETTVIFRPTLSDPELESQIEGIKNAIESSGNTIHKLDVWGRRRLAYPIQGHSEGIYVFFLFSGKPEFIAELNRRYRINENVLRSLTVKCDYPLDDMPPISLDETPVTEEERKPKHLRRSSEEELDASEVSDEEAEENEFPDDSDDE